MGRKDNKDDVIECPHCHKMSKPYMFEQKMFAHRKERAILCGCPECKKVFVEVNSIGK